MSENKTRDINEHPKKCKVITSISGNDVATADVVGTRVVVEDARNELGDEAFGDKLDANKKSLAFFIDRLDRTIKAELERCGLTLFYNEGEGALCVIHKSSKGCVFASKNDYDETDERYNEASFKVSRQRFRFLSVPVGYTRNHDDQFEVRAFPDGMPKA